MNGVDMDCECGGREFLTNVYRTKMRETNSNDDDRERGKSTSSEARGTAARSLEPSDPCLILDWQPPLSALLVLPP